MYYNTIHVRLAVSLLRLVKNGRRVCVYTFIMIHNIIVYV